MKREVLKEVIQNVVAQKLAEAKGTAPVYGYIISGKDTDDPTYQLIGYGNMPKSLWKKKLERYAEEILKRVKNDDWKNVAYYIEKNGVFGSAVNMMKELSEKDLKEIGDVGAAELADTQTDMTDADKKQLATYQAALDKVTNDVRKIDADIAKLHAPVQRKIEGLERKKANLSKKQGQLVDRMNALKSK